MAAIICLGIAVRDIVFTVPSLRAGAHKLTASGVSKGGGGMAATAAAAAATLGGRVDFWTRLGDDAEGRELHAELQSHGVRVHTQVVPGTQTPTAAVLVAPDGERLLAVFPGRLEPAADWLPLDRLASVQAVHADFRWPQGARALYTAAAERRLPRVLDADVGDPATLRALLPLVDHAIFSHAGLAELVAHADVETALRAAAQLSPGVVAVTLGEQGSVFLIDGALHRVPAFNVLARDTNGAGDVFHGAYTLALAEGQGVLEAARFAAAAAALKCRNGSAWAALASRPAVQQLLKENE